MTSLDSMSYAEAARIVREALKDKSYRAYPMGQEAGEYLRWKRGRITDLTYVTYESCLDKLARAFPDLEMADFEPPVGTQRLEEFLDATWGGMEPRTYNKNLSMLADFFKWAVLKGKLHGDPTLPIPRHKRRDVHREIFRDGDRVRILANGPASETLRRDRLALRLILDYGLRKGAVRAIQFRHGDSNRRRLTVFTKGQKVRELPIPDPAWWDDWEKLQFELGSQPHHFLLARHKSFQRFVGYDEKTGKPKTETKHVYYPEQPMGNHGAHDWWYGCLQRAGIVADGVFKGERMHKGRHTAGQRVLDKTKGNLKAVQKLLGHADISTTANIYTDWDVDQLEATLREVLELGD